MRPLFRWIVGDVSTEGYHVLSQAIRNILRIYKNNFDFLICSNAVHENSKKKIKTIQHPKKKTKKKHKKKKKFIKKVK